MKEIARETEARWETHRYRLDSERDSERDTDIKLERLKDNRSTRLTPSVEDQAPLSLSVLSFCQTIDPLQRHDKR